MDYNEITDTVLPQFIESLKGDPMLQEAARKIQAFATATHVRQVMYGMLAIDADVEEAEALAEGFFHTRMLAEIASQQGRFELAAYLNNLMRLAHFHNYNVLPPVTHSTDTGPTSQLGADVPVMHHARLRKA